MGVAKKTRKFATVSSPRLIDKHSAQHILTTSLQVKRVIGKRDARLKENKDKGDIGNEKKRKEAFPEEVREM